MIRIGDWRKHYPEGDLTRIPKGSNYSDCWETHERVGDVYDKDIYAYVRKHTHWYNRIDLHFVSDCVLQARDILTGIIRPPKKAKDKWFFEDYPYGHFISDEEWEYMDKAQYINEYLRI